MRLRKDCDIAEFLHEVLKNHKGKIVISDNIEITEELVEYFNFEKYLKDHPNANIYFDNAVDLFMLLGYLEKE